MKLPFDVEQFFAVFARYNEAVWPAQVVLTGFGLVAGLLVWRRRRSSDRLISALLAGLWAWMGVVYHFVFFRAINPAAALFAVAFVVQAAALFWVGVVRGRLQFRVTGDASSFAAGVLVVYALIAYPAIGQAAGHSYPAAPTFGLPCPTTIFTFGMLMAALPALPRVLLVVPLAWSVVGTMAAMQLGVPQDYGLAVAAVVAAVFTFRPREAAMRQIAIIMGLLCAPVAAAAQSTPPKPELRAFAGANIPTGPQRDLFSDAPMVGAQLALEIKPSMHIVGQFGWVASHSSYPLAEDHVNLYTYDVGIELMAVRPLGGKWELKPFLGVGGGVRTYAYGGVLSDQTCGSGYATIGTEFQLAPWAFRLEARDNLFCYKSPMAGVESETRNDVGLSFGLAYHVR